MVKKERIETMVGFYSHTVFSQFASVITMASTNFLDVTKVRLISDLKRCSKDHYQNKLLVKKIFNKFTGENQITKIAKKCMDCLPSRNSFVIASYILQKEGINHFLFSGLGNAIYANFIRVGLFFPTMEFFKVKTKKILPHHLNVEMTSTLVGSFIARFFTSVISFPNMVSQIRAQSGEFKKDNTYLKNMHNIVNNPKKYSISFLAFFQREVVFTMFFWSIYEQMRKMNKKYYNDDINDIQLKIKSSLVGGFFAAFLTYPFDIIQTNVIVSKQKTDFLRVLSGLRNKYGMSFFFNGLFVRMFKGSIMNGIFFTIYEGLKNKGTVL